ncbi:methyl-accepting chemotaxis protein [Herbaspirillum sp. NPDC087042]|uniref:methyl-accepting chemotaxis protein n=1 Tax=Herbaspirillum sp. NPDC087042 TaxID=3364004 RepID=UPI0037F516A3
MKINDLPADFAATSDPLRAVPRLALPGDDETGYPYPGRATLMSSTDTSSKLTYANATFVDISGYTREDLMGQPHNIVRHPDMPREAFADMWSTLRRGDAWTALVKNRRADGQHYWVRANVTPIRRNGQVHGYLSVRTRPQSAEINAAASLYRRFREGQAGSLAFYKGLVVRRGLGAWTRLGQVMPVRWRLRLALAGVGTSAVALPVLLPGQAVALSAGVLVTLLGAGIWLERSISAPLQQVLAQAKAVASGQPGEAHSLNRVDEIGLLLRATNQAGLNLRALIDDVSAQVHGLSLANQQIAGDNISLRQRTAETHAHLQQTAAAAEEMATAMRHSADTAQSANALARQTSDAATQGGEIVMQVVNTMHQIADSSAQIGEINGLIDSLAFQTNILALNAAVEAARAGEAGRGFAVVAGEVRVLAQRSAKAARDIKQLIAESVSQSQAGARRAEQGGLAMQTIVSEVKGLSALIGEISSSTAEQSQGVAQVSQSALMLDEMTQKNADMVEHSAAAVADMEERVAMLVLAIRVFEQH